MVAKRPWDMFAIVCDMCRHISTLVDKYTIRMTHCMEQCTCDTENWHAHLVWIACIDEWGELQYGRRQKETLLLRILNYLCAR